MDADLDTLCIAVYCTADDLLPEPAGNARRIVTDAEVVTLCVAHAIMGIPSDRRFLKVADKGYAGRECAQAGTELNATIVRPRRRNEPGPGPQLAPIRQRIESIFWTCKELLTLERHGARTLLGIRDRVLQRFLTLAACITLNHQLGRPSRALVDYVA